MDFLTLVFHHFIEVIIFLLIFGGSLRALLRQFVRPFLCASIVSGVCRRSAMRNCV